VTAGAHASKAVLSGITQQAGGPGRAGAASDAYASASRTGFAHSGQATALHVLKIPDRFRMVYEYG